MWPAGMRWQFVTKPSNTATASYVVAVRLGAEEGHSEVVVGDGEEGV